MAISFEIHKPDYSSGTKGKEKVGKKTNKEFLEKKKVSKPKDKLDALLNKENLNKDEKKVFKKLGKLYADIANDFSDKDKKEYPKFLTDIEQDSYTGKHQNLYKKYHKKYLTLQKIIDENEDLKKEIIKLYTQNELSEIKEAIIDDINVVPERVSGHSATNTTVETSRLHSLEMSETRVNYGSLESIDNPEGSKDIVNILNSKKNLKKVVYEVLAEEMGLDKKGMKAIDLKKRSFGINLGMNGLAGLILHIKDNGLEEVKRTGKNIKRLKKGKVIVNGQAIEVKPFTYERNFFDRKFNERRRVAKILNAAKNNDNLYKELLEFAHFVDDSDFVWKKALKQRYNREVNKDYIDKDNVLKSLCDYNADGVLSANYFKDGPDKRGKERRKQTRKAGFLDTVKDGVDQGDIGSIFGPQLYLEMVRAESVLEGKLLSDDFQKTVNERYLGGGSGNMTAKNVILYNILEVVKVQNTDTDLETAIDDLLNNPMTCTQENLLKITQTYSQFQSLFANAIIKINGGKNNVRYNLHDNLIGDFDEKLNFGKDPYATIREEVEKFYSDNNGDWAQLEKQLSNDGFTKVKASIMTMVLTFFDHLEFQSNTSNQMGDIHKWFLAGERQTDKYKQRMLASLVKKFLGAMVRGEKVGDALATITIGPSFMRSRTSKDGKWKWNFKARAGLTLNLLDPKSLTKPNIGLYVGFGGARQLNYRQVVSDRLDNLHSARYQGIKAYVGGKVVNGIDVGAQIGSYTEIDKEVAIEQRHHQLDGMLTAITDLNQDTVTINGISTSFTPLSGDNFASKKAFDKALDARVEALRSSFGKAGRSGKPFLKFIENNKDYLKGSYTFMTSLMERETVDNKRNLFNFLSTNDSNYATDVISIGIMYDANKIATESTWKNLNKNEKNEKILDYKKQIINNLMRGMKSGIIEQSRQESLMQLHGKTKITSLGAGLGFNRFGGKGNKNGEEPKDDPYSHANENEGSTDSVPSHTPSLSLNRGIFYFEGTFSTYRNYYTANALQREIAVQDIREGKKSRDIMVSSDDMDEYLQSQLVYPGYGEAYGDKEDLVSVENTDGKIVLKSTDPAVDLSKVLNVRCVDSKLDKVKWTDDGLVIGDVGMIDVECISDGKGVSYTLILGQKGTQLDGQDNTVRLGKGHNADGTIEAIKGNGNLEWTETEFKTQIVDGFSGDGKANANVVLSTLLDDGFLENGMLKKLTGSKVTLNDKEYNVICDYDEIKIDVGTLNIQVEDDNIHIGYDDTANSDRKLKVDYKETVSTGKSAWTYDSIKNKVLSDFSGSSANNAKEIVMKFIDKYANLVIPSGFDILGDNSWVGKSLTKGGVFGITKEKDGKYNVRFIPGKKEGGVLEITYIVEAGTESWVVDVHENDIDLLGDHKDVGGMIDILLNDQKVKLYNLEKKYPKTYYRFLAVAAKNIKTDADALISENEIDKAGNLLFNMLKDSVYSDLKTTFYGGSYKKKAYIIDRFKTLFSLEKSAYMNHKLSYFFKKRKNVYTTLTGPSGVVFPKSLSNLREELISSNRGLKDKKYSELNQKSYNNIIAYTAQYRKRNKFGAAHRNYSLTAMGSTKILGDYKLTLKDNNRESVKKWFIDNLKINKFEQETLLARVKKLTNISKLDDKQLLTLLDKKELEITIDNKKKKITLDAEYIFFLLGECANESLGLRIKGITVEERQNNTEKETYTGAGENLQNEEITTADAEGTPIEEPGMKFASGTGVVTNLLHTHRTDIEWRHLMKMKQGKKEVEEPEDDPYSNPDEHEEGDDDAPDSGGDEDEEGDDDAPGDDGF